MAGSVQSVRLFRGGAAEAGWWLLPEGSGSPLCSEFDEGLFLCFLWQMKLGVLGRRLAAGKK